MYNNIGQEIATKSNEVTSHPQRLVTSICRTVRDKQHQSTDVKQLVGRWKSQREKIER